MEKSFFRILENDYKELAQLGYKIDNEIFTHPSSAIVNSRLFAEKVLAKVAEIEDEHYIMSLKQYERIKHLNKEGMLEDEIVKYFDEIRITGNIAVHEGKKNDIEHALRIHKKIYKIVKWFVEAYGSDYNSQVSEYRPPEFPKVKNSISQLEIESILEKKIAEYIKLNNNNTLEKSKDEDIVIDNKLLYSYKKLKGSYLLNELSKLSDSSKEAVESYKELDQFKKYLHIERSIQRELKEILQEANVSDESQLVLLCGSVGDGKSHLLAYFNEEYPEIMNNFSIHNDATESISPELTEIETLKVILNPFRDDSIDKSNEKHILAINLGVLNNFLQDDDVKANYTKLIEFITNSNIFNQDITNRSCTSNKFKLISFGDYNIYEITADGPKSDYINTLLNKVINKSENNFFYNAYLRDTEENHISPVILNYKILSSPGMVDKITDLIVASIVKNKKILGTRELLNFIYELLVPTNIDGFDMASSSMDYINSVLPNTLFASQERGNLLKSINKEDPLKLRNEEIDKLLIKLNISSDVKSVLNEYFDGEIIEIVEFILVEIDNLDEITDSTKQDIIDTIIRLLYLTSDEKLSEFFEDEAYVKFMKYLYYFNCGKIGEYKDLFEEVRKSIINLNGSPKDKYIYLNEELQNFKVAEPLDFRRSKYKSRENIDIEVIEKFKTDIMLGFEVQSKGVHEALSLDYELYKKIMNINKGYYISKNDREEGILFIEFIETLLSHGDMKNELLIEDKRDENKFFLRHDYLDGEFTFERLEV